MKHHSLLLIIIASLLMVTRANATDFYTIDGLRYLVDTDTHEATLVVSENDKYSGNIIVPKKVAVEGDEYPVTALGRGCFQDCVSLQSIVIPETVKKMGESCFSGCSSLKAIDIPDSITSLEASCFYKCSSLTSIILPSFLEMIGKSCFNSCSSLKQINIPSSVKSIGSGCFEDCISLETIDIPSNVTELQDNCFMECSSLKSINIPSTVKKIGWWCFWACKSLTMLNIPSSVESLGTGCFNLCTSLRTVTLGKSLKDIENDCFSNCTNLKAVYCYAERPPEYFAQKYVGLKLGQNSNSVLYVPEASLEKYKNALGWKDFIAILPISNLDDNFQVFTTNGITYSVNSLDERNVNVTSAPYNTVINIPSTFMYEDYVWNVKSISASALRGNTNVISITIPSSVSFVDNSTFNGCSNLAVIVWNASTPLTNAIIGSGQSDNLLVFVKSSDFAPARSRNVVVNGSAENIVLTDATSSKNNNFYSPQAFTAKNITYQHRYSMRTEINTCQGWETIALPFDVQSIKHESKGEITPFASWNGNDGKPFWLYEMTTNGWRHASSIKANTPYIISMPNNDVYDEDYNLSGTVTFSAENVMVKASDDIEKSSYNNQTFSPNFTTLQQSSGVYALNVNNDFASYSGSYNQGSHFISSLRSVKPFEAYMSTSGNMAKKNALTIYLGNTTDIQSLNRQNANYYKVFNLHGQLVKASKALSPEAALKGLPAAVYIVNGKKMVVK